MLRGFATLARLTAVSKIFKILIHAWPKKITLYDFYHFVMTHMASNLRVMLYLTYHFVQVILCWDRLPSFVIKGPLQVLYIGIRITITWCIGGFLLFLILHSSCNYMFHQVWIEFDWRDYVKF
jgi:hypothetical protein